MTVQRLTEAAELDRLEYESLADGYGCSCHLNPPCCLCTHPGNPNNQAEDPECWETAGDLTEELWTRHKSSQ